jgi:hypothetical protein
MLHGCTSIDVAHLTHICFYLIMFTQLWSYPNIHWPHNINVKVTALRFEAEAVVLFRIKVLWDVMLDH